MSNYVFITDSGCDLSAEVLAKWGVKSCPLSFRFDGEDTDYADGEMDPVAFYQRMREGSVAKTSAVSPEAFREAFEKELKEGRDVLYIGFSGGLSNTCNAGRLAAEELAEKYPDRKILTFNSLSASAGQALLIYLLLQKQKEGATIEEAARYAADIHQNVSQWFTVDDLKYLKRGGRVSPAVALVGGVLGIKPLLHVDSDGHLSSVAKVRGRKAALVALADKYAELCTDKNAPVFVSHADCLDDVKELEKLLQVRGAKGIELVTFVGTVIGAHAGPGTLAMFFVGKNR